MSKLTARDGDILVVSYPEVTIPITQFSTVRVAGLIYTRKLVAGEDPMVQYRQIYDFLKAQAQADGRIKVQEYREEILRARGQS